MVGALKAKIYLVQLRTKIKNFLRFKGSFTDWIFTGQRILYSAEGSKWFLPELQQQFFWNCVATNIGETLSTCNMYVFFNGDVDHNDVIHVYLVHVVIRHLATIVKVGELFKN